MKVRRRPNLVSAFRFGIDAIPEWFKNMLDSLDAYYYPNDGNPKGVIRVNFDDNVVWLDVEQGDIVVNEGYGYIHPIEASTFAMMFEVVER